MFRAPAANRASTMMAILSSKSNDISLAPHAICVSPNVQAFASSDEAAPPFQESAPRCQNPGDDLLIL